MKVITNDMMDFREIVRNMWNVHLRFTHPNDPIERSISFDKIVRELFSSLISSMNFSENERGDYGVSPSPIFLSRSRMQTKFMYVFPISIKMGILSGVIIKLFQKAK